MGINLNKEKDGTTQVIFDYDSNEANQIKRQVFNDIRKNLRIDGFRKGKISLQMAQKLFGKNFLDDEIINKHINPEFSNYLKEEKIEPLSQPNLSTFEYDDDGGLNVAVEFFTAPEFTVSLSQALSETEDLDVLNDAKLKENLDEEVIYTLLDYFEKTPVNREIQDNDLVELEVLDSNYRYYIPNEITIIVGKENPYIDAELTKELIGKEKGKLARLKDGNLFYDLKIKDNYEYKIPEFTEEFVKENFDFDTVDEFKEFLKGINLMSKSGRLSFKNGRKLLEHVVDNTDLEISPLFIEELKGSYRDHLEDMSKWDSKYSAEDSVEDNLKKLAKEYLIYSNLTQDMTPQEKEQMLEFRILHNGTKYEDFVMEESDDNFINLMLELKFYRNFLERTFDSFYQMSSYLTQGSNE